MHPHVPSHIVEPDTVGLLMQMDGVAVLGVGPAVLGRWRVSFTGAGHQSAAPLMDSQSLDLDLHVFGGNWK